MQVIVAGAGPGALAFYTEHTLAAIRSADLVLTAQRLAAPLSAIAGNVKVMGVMDTIAYLNEHAEKEEKVCVVASGDTGFYSIARTIADRVDPNISVSFACGIGSLSYFAAKLKIGYEQMKLVSLHGRESSIVPHVCYNESVFALTGGTIKAADVIQQLLKAGLTAVRVHVGEHLSSTQERIVSGTPVELENMQFDDLAVVVVENKDYANRYKTLKDSDFIRGKSPMTKEVVRNLSLAALEIEPQDIVYDIGAGTGSVTCAMAYRASESMVYAVEKNPEAVDLVKENMAATGARNIEIHCALAPDALAEFPPADKVFIGGSTGNLREIMEAVLQRNQKAVFVVTAVTLETITQAVGVFAALSMETETICANISAAQKLGNYHLMKAENPVYIIKGAKQLEH
ncbi:precorrin-6y C5,15-methyltransferase (decarboxylating) subunit CbiE [Ihubacter sp. rT4E-8]|uniref:precorrin-6y C5,15-methyltransferase (decarboxylating) subunit CbiE n=1 Tax=Ihubacter sp. rT4E-8 TaxID=3242369 RepID=UPI003CF78811